MTYLSSPKLLPLYRHIYTNQNQGWEINADKIQGPEQSVKFFRIVWLGKTKVTLAEVIDKIRALPTPQLVKELQSLEGGLTRLLASVHTSSGTNNTTSILSS